MLLEPLRHIMTVSGFGAVYFRRTSKQHTAEGGAWDESFNIYPHLGAEERSGYLDWSFPPHGNRISFAHMEHEKNRLDWKSSQIPLLMFDQLEDFTRNMFFYMLSRNRSTCGVRPYIRGGYNPVPADDPAGGWLHEFVAWYLDDNQEYPDPAKSGVIRWFVNIDDSLHWFDSKAAALARFPDTPPKSFTFIPASIYDNKILLAKDPGYVANLMALPPVDQERLLYSNHRIRPEAGKVFNRSWFKIVDELPLPAVDTVRFWDFAATEKKQAAGAATSSVKMARAGKKFYILDVTEDWLGPAEVDDHAESIARQDGRAVRARWEEEGGSAGKKASYALVTRLAGLDAEGVRPQGDKMARSRPLAAQAKAGNVLLMRGEWNERFLTHMHNIPDGKRWDIHDAAAGAFNELNKPVYGKPGTVKYA